MLVYNFDRDSMSVF